MRINNTCDDTCCRLKCGECEICVHLFVCECPDYIIKKDNICKHVHACILALRRTNPGTHSPIQNQKPSDFQIFENALVNHEEKDEHERMRSATLQKWELFGGFCISW